MYFTRLGLKTVLTGGGCEHRRKRASQQTNKNDEEKIIHSFIRIRCGDGYYYATFCDLHAFFVFALSSRALIAFFPAAHFFIYFSFIKHSMFLGRA